MKIEELINLYRDNLNKTDLFIWKYISQHKKECCEYTIYELADKCYVSTATILRFAKKLSLVGFPELKALLRFEGSDNSSSREYDISRVFEFYNRVINDMSKKNFDSINELIYNAKNLYVYATGVMQNNIANELSRLFNNSGHFIINIGNSGEARIFLNNIDSNSLVFVISLSGENKSSIDLARGLKLKDVPIISITKLCENTLSTICNESIYVQSLNQKKPIENNTDPISSVGFFIAIETMYYQYRTYVENMNKGKE